jgi:hypothetical protein
MSDPLVKAAVVEAAPIVFDTPRTLKKLVDLTRDAADGIGRTLLPPHYEREWPHYLMRSRCAPLTVPGLFALPSQCAIFDGRASGRYRFVVVQRRVAGTRPGMGVIVAVVTAGHQLPDCRCAS